jgi:hypothetical protein
MNKRISYDSILKNPWLDFQPNRSIFWLSSLKGNSGSKTISPSPYEDDILPPSRDMQKFTPHTIFILVCARVCIYFIYHFNFRFISVSSFF